MAGRKVGGRDLVEPNIEHSALSVCKRLLFAICDGSAPVSGAASCSSWAGIETSRSHGQKGIAAAEDGRGSVKIRPTWQKKQKRACQPREASLLSGLFLDKSF